jgi:hypothetical protein
MNQRRIIAAFLLSPLAGSLYIVALTIFEKGLWHQIFKGGLWSVLEDILGMTSMVLFFAIIGYVAEGTLGVPCYAYFAASID